MKMDRIDIRVTREQKEILARAAELSGVSMSSFLVANGLSEARKVVTKSEKISRNVDREGFDCGVPSLNDYLKRSALQILTKNVGVAIVAVPEDNRKRVLGYYSVSMGQVEFASMPEDLAQGLPRYPIPAMGLGRLAVAKSTQGPGVGGALLRDALQRAVSLSREAGTCVVLVDAIDERAKAIYERYGFIPLQDIPLTLVVPVQTIVAAAPPEEYHRAFSDPPETGVLFRVAGKMKSCPRNELEKSRIRSS